MIHALFSGVATFFLALALGEPIVRYLRRKKIGKKVSEHLPEHQKKAGTPTFGGFMIWLPTFIVTAVAVDWWKHQSILLPLGMIGITMAAGFVDDLGTLQHRPQKGLSWRFKIAFTSLFALGAAIVAIYQIEASNTEEVSIVKNTGGAASQMLGQSATGAQDAEGLSDNPLDRWVAGPHSDTYVVSTEGTNDKCNQCHDPINYIPSMEDMPASCTVCKFKVDPPPPLTVLNPASPSHRRRPSPGATGIGSATTSPGTALRATWKPWLALGSARRSSGISFSRMCAPGRPRCLRRSGGTSSLMR